MEHSWVETVVAQKQTEHLQQTHRNERKTNGLSDLDNDRHQRPILDGQVGNWKQSQLVCTETRKVPATVPMKKTMVTVRRVADHTVDEMFLRYVSGNTRLGLSLTDTVPTESHGHSPRYTKNCRYGTDDRNGKRPIDCHQRISQLQTPTQGRQQFTVWSWSQ